MDFKNQVIITNVSIYKTDPYALQVKSMYLPKGEKSLVKFKRPQCKGNGKEENLIVKIYFHPNTHKLWCSLENPQRGSGMLWVAHREVSNVPQEPASISQAGKSSVS